MIREKLGQIIDYSKDLGLTLSIVFIENGVQQKEHINFNNISDIYICNDENLMLYNELIKRWATINIANIAYIEIHEKVIY